MMHLVRSRRSGGLALAAAAIATSVVVACANGAQNGIVFIEGEGGALQEGGLLPDGSMLPGPDSGLDTGTPGGSCTKKVVINEVLVNGPGGGEFVELYNPNTCAVSLDGWRIAYKSEADKVGTAAHAFTANDSLAAKAFFVVGTSTFSGKKDATFDGGFGNSGGQVGLRDGADAIVDAVGYGPNTAGEYTEKAAAALPPANDSIARKSDGVDTDDNEADFAASTPTPGAPN
jgi:hypothetical protein